ncbi:MAG: response regulator receiver protein [Microvirga sp.]|jgi:FixJ family two-component response regulator|nr:response regulator receiver protein [Microvirga sp.]
MVAIIDDDESVRLATASLVRSLGLSTSTFASAEEFLFSPQLDDAACVITDVQMIGMSGVDLQAYLLKHGNDIPVIFMTAFPEERIRQQVCAAGAIGFLSKPFDGGMMIECIDRALQQPRAARSEHSSHTSPQV